MAQKLTNILIPVLAIAVSVILVSLPLLSKGFLVTDDGGWMIVRFSAFYQELIHGQFPVRWLNRLNNGYGYPVSTFLYPGFMYFASLFKAFGVGYIVSIKLVIIFSVIVTVSSIYLWLRKWFSSISALAGGIAVVFSPYYLFDIYQRGSVGEVLAFAWIAAALYAIAHNRSLLTGFLYALIILSHNTLALLFIPVLIIYSLLENSNWKKPLWSLLIGLGLSAFYWLPVLYELKLTQFNSVQVSEYGKYFALDKPFDFFGYVQSVVFILVITISARSDRNKRLWFFGLLAALGIGLSLPVSSVIWKNTGIAQYVQFPFRFVSFWTVSIAYIMAVFVSYLMKLKPSAYWKLGVFMIAIFLLYQWKGALVDVEYSQLPDSYYATNEATTTVKDEYMPMWVMQKPEKRPQSLVEVLQGSADVLQVSDDINSITFSVVSQTKSLLQLNRVFWPGWQLTVSGKKADINYQNEAGLMQFEVPQGKSVVKFVFGETKYRLMSDAISGTVFILLVLLWIKKPEFI